jgi:hypothetical protein
LSNPYYDARANVQAKLADMLQLLQDNDTEVPLTALTTHLTTTPEGPNNWRQFCRKRFKGYQSWTVTNGGRSPAENLRFARSTQPNGDIRKISINFLYNYK